MQNKAWAIISSMSLFLEITCFIITALSAITVNPNATETLNTAVIAADSAYTPNRTIMVYVVEARNENA